MSKSLPPLATKRLYRQIADVLRDRIDAGAFEAGDALPPERELAAQLGVSRTSVREALVALEVEGRVSVKVGSGVTVLAAAPPREARRRRAGARGAAGEIWSEVGPLEIVEARLAIEPEAAALAAANATDAEIEELRAVLADLVRESHQPGLQWPSDRRFHECVARFSGNAAFERLVSMLWQQRASPLFRKLDELFADQQMMDRSEAEHGRILEAIEARDPELARLAMRTHLSRVRATYTRGIE